MLGTDNEERVFAALLKGEIPPQKDMFPSNSSQKKRKRKRTRKRKRSDNNEKEEKESSSLSLPSSLPSLVADYSDNNNSNDDEEKKQLEIPQVIKGRPLSL